MPTLGPFDPFDRPPCWVFYQGIWCPGRIHQWFPHADGWTAMVAFEVGTSGYYQEVPVERLADGSLPAPSDGPDHDVAPPWAEREPPWLDQPGQDLTELT